MVFFGAALPQTAIERGGQETEHAIATKHQLERRDPADAGIHEHIGHGGAERTRRARHGADQAIAREHSRAVAVGHVARQHGLLERHQHADVAARRIDGADEGDGDDQQQIFDVEHDAGRRHQHGAGNQQVAQLIARGDDTDAEREQRRAKQRGRRHDADLDRAETDRHQIGRQHDGGKTVAKTADAAGDQ